MEILIKHYKIKEYDNQEAEFFKIIANNLILHLFLIAAHPEKSTVRYIFFRRAGCILQFCLTKPSV